MLGSNALSQGEILYSAELNSYVGSPRAHKLYYNEGFQILGFHFQNKLNEEKP